MAEPEHLAPGVIGPLSDDALAATIWDADFDAWAGIVPALDPDADDDPLAAATGLMVGCGLVAPMWALGWLAWRWWLS